MADQEKGGLVAYAIKVGGNAIPDSVQLFQIDIEQTLNRISTAKIIVLDGNPASESFTVSASDTFVPGNDITIELGYSTQTTLIFSGVITQQHIRASGSTGPMLEIECKDKAIKMTVGRKSAGYSKSKDSDVISKLIGAAGLSADVSATTVVIPELVQYYTSDWDFMLARAEVNGLVVSTINGKVRVFNPISSTTSKLTLTYGDDLYAFNARLNAVTQYAQVKACAWDYQNQQLISAQASNDLAGPGNLSSKKLADVIGLSNFSLQTAGAESSDELTAWAKAQMLKSELSKITGDAQLQGTTALLPGDYVTLAGLGTRFNGDHFVSSVHHSVSDGNWFTEIRLGLSIIWFVQENEVEAPAAAGLLPGIGGMFTGTVKKIDEDPDAEYRILVEVALFNDAGQGLWARLANFYSTNGEGVFFLPEVGDEVVLGFLNQDPRYPVILGSLYSQKNKPFSQFTPNAKNSLKGIVSKQKLQVLFDDEKVVLTLTTPNNNTIELDDKNKQITIKDCNSNSIVMSSSGIDIKSAKNINLQADQAISIKGNTGITLQSSGGDVSVTAVNIKQNANAQYSAQGSASAQVQGGAELTLKAAMVMIN